MRTFIEKYANVLVWGFIPLVSLLMHLPILNRPLMGIHVWRQTQTQTNIRNFAEEDMNLLNPRVDNLAEGGEGGIKRMEFPLMQWVFAWFYKIFGDSIFISRILSFTIGMLSLGGISTLFRWLLQDKVAALIGTWAFQFSPVVYYYVVNPMPDNLALCFGIWGLALFYAWIRNPQTKFLWLSACLIGLATAVKLPFILVLAIPLGHLGLQLIQNRGKEMGKLIKTGIPFLIFLIPAAAWYIWVIPTWTGNGIVQGIGGEQGTDWGSLWDVASYNFYSILPEVLLNYASVPAFLLGFFFLIKQKGFRSHLFGPLVLFGLGLLAYYFFEMNMILKIHDYYLFPFLPALFIIVAYGIRELLKLNKTWSKVFVGLMIVVMPITAFLRMQPRWDYDNAGFNPDLLSFSTELSKRVPPDEKILAGADDSPHVWLYYLHHEGWAFQHWELTPEWIDARMAEGATYIYLDLPYAELQPAVQDRLETTYSQRGSIQVYRLTSAP